MYMFYIIVLMPWHNYWVSGRISLLMTICFQCLMIGYPIERFVLVCYIKYCFLVGDLSPIYRRNSVEFLVDFWELKLLEITWLIGWVRVSIFFERAMISYVLRVIGSGRLIPIQRHAMVVTCWPLGRGVTFYFLL